MTKILITGGAGNVRGALAFREELLDKHLKSFYFLKPLPYVPIWVAKLLKLILQNQYCIFHWRHVL